MGRLLVTGALFVVALVVLVVAASILSGHGVPPFLRDLGINP